jgi:hypothetical protein
MRTNESAIDRVMRMFIGVILLSLVVIGPKTLWGLIGLVPLATGLVGFCPLYRVLGITSCPARPGDQAA